MICCFLAVRCIWMIAVDMIADANLGRLPQFKFLSVFPQSDAEHDMLLFGSPMRLDDRRRYDCGCESGPSSSLRQPTVAYHRLSSSVGEVQVQSDFEEETHLSLKKDRLGQSLESTHSLTYLEWVHERQTRRMRTRSEWFLSPALPTKNGVSSKPADFECGVASTSKHHAMFDDDFMSSIEDITDMRSAIADSPQFSLNRQPLQPLRLQGEQMSTHISSPQGVRQPSEGDATKSSRNVIRRRSWRTHYVRPNNRSPPEANEDGSSRSTPVHRRYIASVQSASMPCSRRVSGAALAVSPTASSATNKMLASSISRSDEESAKKSSTHTKFVHF
uniref:Uncharacterized protein n=1 Tax=Ascaris lumbricoides TaxID=6252 RepID=A0A9J2PH94_ASCLU